MFYFLLNLLFFCFTTVVGTFVWNGVDIFFRVFRENPLKEPKNEEKILNNLVSGCHAYSVVFLDFLKYIVGFNISPIYFHIIFSTGYFTYDTILQFFRYKSEGFKNEQLGYSLHHIMSILFLWVAYYYPEVRHLTYLFGIIETSNLCSYVVYHCLKSGYSEKIVKRLKEAQVVNYVFFRIPVLGFVLYDMWDYIYKYNLSIFFIILYLMGVQWSYRLLSAYLEPFVKKTKETKETKETDKTSNDNTVEETKVTETVETQETKDEHETTDTTNTVNKEKSE